MDKVQALLTGCIVFGIYNHSEFLSRKKFKKYNRHLEILQQCYTCGIALLCCISCVWGINHREYDEGFMVTWWVSTFVFVWQIITHMIILLEALWRREQHNDFLHKLSEIEVALKVQLKQTINRRALIQQLQRCLLLWMSVAVLSMIIFAIFSHKLHEVGYYWYALGSVLTIRLRTIQLLLYVQILHAYLQSYNFKLQQIVAAQKPQQLLLLFDIIDCKHLQSAATLKTLRGIYALLFEAFHLLNECAGWSLFAIVACYCMDFTCHIYWFTLALERVLSRYVFITTSTVVLPMGVILCKLCHMANKCQQEAQHSKHLINKLLVTSMRNKTSKHYNCLVYEFVLQLQHQSIILTAKQFFNFDLSLIMSICVAIASYLVILVQFSMAEG